MSETQAQMWLLVIVGLCGFSFGMVKYAGATFDTSTILAARFVVASACLIPWLRQVKPEMIPAGLETGAWLAAGYLSQALCMSQGTKAGTAAFMAAMTSIFTPFLERMYGVRLTAKAWGAAGLALLGSAFLSLDNGVFPKSCQLDPKTPQTNPEHQSQSAHPSQHVIPQSQTQSQGCFQDYGGRV